MPNHASHSAKAVDLVGDARRRLRQIFAAAGGMTPAERQAMDELTCGLIEEQRADRSLAEGIYALQHGLPDAPSGHHARQRRELAQAEAALLGAADPLGAPARRARLGARR